MCFTRSLIIKPYCYEVKRTRKHQAYFATDSNQILSHTYQHAKLQHNHAKAYWAVDKIIILLCVLIGQVRKCIGLLTRVKVHILQNKFEKKTLANVFI